MAEHLEFESDLWKASNRLRGSIEGSQYKHIVLALMFLKYLSDAYEERKEELLKRMNDKNDDLYEEDSDEQQEILNDPDRYGSVFFVPEKARWSFLKSKVKDTELPTLVDNAMEIIETANEYNKKRLNNVLPKVFVRSRIPYETLGELINTFTKIGFGTSEAKEKDVLGRVYEYFLKMFAMSEGKRGGEFYTPESIVRLLVEVLEPYEGRVYDPCCGSGGMFVQSAKFIKSHEGKTDNIAILGQENIDTTWRLCKMNLFLRGLEGDIALGDTLLNDQHKGKQANRIIANPPFNLSEWKNDSIDKDKRWEYGLAPNSNANYAWIQHMINHLEEENGLAGFVLANGSLSVGGTEGDIREEIIKADLVDCIIALPPQLFFTTQIPACLWFIAKNKKEHNGFKETEKEKPYSLMQEKYSQEFQEFKVEFSPDQLKEISDTVKKYRGELDGYEDVEGYCKEATLEDIEKHNFVLTPGRYVGLAEEENGDDEPFEDKMTKLTADLAELFEQSDDLKEKIKKILGVLALSSETNPWDEMVSTVIEKAIQEPKYPFLAFGKEKSIKQFQEVINLFLEGCLDEFKDLYKEEIAKINNYPLMDRFVQAIVNINYLKQFSDEHLGIKFMLYCAGIESYYNLHNENNDEAISKFVSFMKNISDPSKDLIVEKFELNKSVSKSNHIKKFCRYIYQKRSEFVHRGTHFGFNKTSGYIDRFDDDDIQVELKLRFPEFEKIVYDALLQNLKEDIQNGN